MSEPTHREKVKQAQEVAAVELDLNVECPDTRRVQD
jgi:hypothetical protein